MVLLGRQSLQTTLFFLSCILGRCLIADAAAVYDGEAAKQEHTFTFEDIIFTLLFFGAVWLCGKVVFLLTGVPSLVGEIIVGSLLGPPLANFVPFPEALALYGEVGFLLTALEAGLEIDLPVLRSMGHQGIAVALCGALLPAGIGYALAAGFGKGWKECLVVSAALSPSSLAVAIHVLKQYRAMDTALAAVIVSAAAIQEVLALVFLSELLKLNEHPSPWELVVPVLSSLAYMLILGAAALFLVPRLLKQHVLPRISGPHIEAKNTEYIVLAAMLAIAMGMVTVTYYSRSSYVMGAFLTGLFFCTVPYVERAWAAQVKRYQHWLLRLFFACTVGFSVPLRTFWRGDVLGLGFSLLLALVGKMVSGFVCRLSWEENIVLGLAMSSWGEFAFIIAVSTRLGGVISQDTFSSLVLGVLISSAVGPLVFDAAIAHVRRRTDAITQAEVGASGGRVRFYHMRVRCRNHWGVIASLQEAMKHANFKPIDFRVDAVDDGSMMAVEIFMVDMHHNKRSPRVRRRRDLPGKVRPAPPGASQRLEKLREDIHRELVGSPHLHVQLAEGGGLREDVGVEIEPFKPGQFQEVVEQKIQAAMSEGAGSVQGGVWRQGGDPAWTAWRKQATERLERLHEAIRQREMRAAAEAGVAMEEGSMGKGAGAPFLGASSEITVSGAAGSRLADEVRAAIRKGMHGVTDVDAISLDLEQQLEDHLREGGLIRPRNKRGSGAEDGVDESGHSWGVAEGKAFLAKLKKGIAGGTGKGGVEQEVKSMAGLRSHFPADLGLAKGEGKVPLWPKLGTICSVAYTASSSDVAGDKSDTARDKGEGKDKGEEDKNKDASTKGSTPATGLAGDMLRTAADTAAAGLKAVAATLVKPVAKVIKPDKEAGVSQPVSPIITLLHDHTLASQEHMAAVHANGGVALAEVSHPALPGPAGGSNAGDLLRGLDKGHDVLSRVPGVPRPEEATLVAQPIGIGGLGSGVPGAGSVVQDLVRPAAGVAATVEAQAENRHKSAAVAATAASVLAGTSTDSLAETGDLGTGQLRPLDEHSTSTAVSQPTSTGVNARSDVLPATPTSSDIHSMPRTLPRVPSRVWKKDGAELSITTTSGASALAMAKELKNALRRQDTRSFDDASDDKCMSLGPPG